MKKLIRVVARRRSDNEKARHMEIILNDMYGESFWEPHFRYWRVRNAMLNNHLDTIRLDLRPYSQTQLDLMKGGRSHMKAKKKGVNAKLKKAKTAKAKKALKAKK